MIILVASLVAQRLKTCDLRKLGYVKKTVEMLRTNDKYQINILTAALENCKKSTLKYFKEKSNLLDFGNASAIPCPRLHFHM